MFRHIITEINIRKLIEMQARQNVTRVVRTKSVRPASGKKKVKKFNRYD